MVAHLHDVGGWELKLAPESLYGQGRDRTRLVQSSKVPLQDEQWE